MLSRQFVNDMSANTNGVNLPRVSTRYINQYSFPLPPHPIQRAIVSKIEALFSDLDNGIANLKKAQQQLKVYRQAVLKKAFEGALTKEWRAMQKGLLTTELFLEELKEERRKYYDDKFVEWKHAVVRWEANGKNEKKPSRPSKPKEFSKVSSKDIIGYEKLPGSWGWSRLGSVTYKIGDIDHKMPKSIEGGLPYLSTGDIKEDGSIDLDNAKTISKEDFDRLALLLMR